MRVFTHIPTRDGDELGLSRAEWSERVLGSVSEQEHD